jgi:hypothetical protein
MRSGTNASSVSGSFTYAVYDSRGQYPGCCYLYPMGRRTPPTEELLTSTSM